MGQSSAGTWDLGTAELDRLCGGERIQRPSPRERLSGEWDWFGQLSVADRRWFGRHCMADIGERPEDVQRRGGFETIDAAMTAVLAAARIDMRARARRTATQAGQLSVAEVAEWEESARRADRTDFYGPQELAAILGKSVPAVHQMSSRGKLPAADMIVSKVPMWHGETLRAAGLMGG